MYMHTLQWMEPNIFAVAMCMINVRTASALILLVVSA